MIRDSVRLFGWSHQVSRGESIMFRYGNGIGVNTLLIVVALILGIIALAGLYTPLILVEIAIILLAIAHLF
jgi:hypothetical protein